MTGICLLSLSSLFIALLKGQRRHNYLFLEELQVTINSCIKVKSKSDRFFVEYRQV